MGKFRHQESTLQEAAARLNHVLLPGLAWRHTLRQGQFFRLVDLEGNQAVDTTFNLATQPEEHYSLTRTIVAQGNIYLTTGSVLYSESDIPLLEIVADTCGGHDTLFGCCSAQSNTVRYGHDTGWQHNCRDSFMLLLAETGGLGKRDLSPNVNFFMNVPLDPAGNIKLVDGCSSPGCYVELRALNDVIVLISNCPQTNNPCNAFKPTAVQLLAWDGK